MYQVSSSESADAEVPDEGLAPKDSELLQRYAADGDEAAFAELVRRHSGLVYSSALRQTGDPHLAEDVAQVVFVLLARKAPALCGKTVLVGWLFNTTRFAVANAMKSHYRRQRREQEVFLMNTTASETQPHWEDVAPCLDVALADLSEKDRTAILLRFFEQKSFREIGDACGVAEDGARRRVDRAMEKLRRLLVRRGITIPTVSLAMLLSSNAASGGTAEISNRIIESVTSGVSVPLASLADDAARSVTLCTLKRITWAAATIAVTVCALWFLSSYYSTRTDQRPLNVQVMPQELDRILAMGNADALIALIHYPTRDHEVLRPLMAEWLEAFQGFWKVYYASNKPDMSQTELWMKLLQAMAPDQLQPAKGSVSQDRAAVEVWPGYSFHFILEDGKWKWNCLESQKSVREIREHLRRNTAALQTTARLISGQTLAPSNTWQIFQTSWEASTPRN